MPITCENIPNTEQVKKALHGTVPSLVRARLVGECDIPLTDKTKLAPCVVPVYYKKFADEIEAMEVFSDDVWVVSFPKCGTTWTQEMVWLIQNNLDFVTAKNVRIAHRFRFIELSGIMRDSKFLSNKSTIELAQEMPRPRFIKTHLHTGLIPKQFWTVKPKLVYVARNPKDAAISFYHHYVNIQHYKGTKEDFLDTFLNDLACWSPYREHILEYWQLRNEPNVLFIKYEEMSKDLMSVLRKTAKFLDKTYSDEQFNDLAKHLSFGEMRDNVAVNFEYFVEGQEKQYGEMRPNENFRFLRRGQVNSAQDEMPLEYHKKFDEWWAEAVQGYDLKFEL